MIVFKSRINGSNCRVNINVFIMRISSRDISSRCTRKWIKPTLLEDGVLSGWVERLGSLTPTNSVCVFVCVCARTCDNFAHFSVEAESKCQQYEVASSLICPSHPSHISSPSSLPCFLSFSFLSPVNLLHHWADEEKVTQLCPNYSITFVFLVAFSFSHSMPKLNRTIPAIALWWWARVHLIILVK